MKKIEDILNNNLIIWQSEELGENYGKDVIFGVYESAEDIVKLMRITK